MENNTGSEIQERMQQLFMSSLGSELKVFNTAKKFAEEILFPIMADFRKYQRQANFGSTDLNTSLTLTEEIRDIQRFNGLKGMAETTQMLYSSISSTVLTNNRKEEVKKMLEMHELLNKFIRLFYDYRELFFVQKVENGVIRESLNRDFFESVKRGIEAIYINAEILMNKNRLLGIDSKDDFLTDDEIKEAIKKEYVEN